MASDESKVVKFYENKNIFITGATGFVGVCLIAKLLEECPTLKNIYILLRPKVIRGKEVNVNDRLVELIKKFKVFKNVTDFTKLVPVAGDVGEENLGLSEANRKLLCDNINIVFHSAACLDFEDKLLNIYTINSLGTQRLLKVCLDMPKLQSFVYVSSAYACSFRPEAEEQVYGWPLDKKEMLKLITTMSEEEMVSLNDKYQRHHPNAYTYSKHIAEQIVEEHAEKIPCGIVRPSMITGAWHYPEAGWTTSKNGPQGFIMGAAKGVIRRLPVAKRLIYDYIPIDIVVNELIVVAYHVGTTRPESVAVFNCTSSTHNPFSWSLVEAKVNVALHKYPLKSAVWYPSLKLVESIQHFKISALFVHVIPGFFLDLITRLSGGRPILLRLHGNVNRSLDKLEKFIFTQWLFSNVKTLELHESLNDVDQKRFNLNIATLKWDEYFENLTLGVRQYLNNEPLTNLAAARRKDKILLVIHTLLQILLTVLIWYCCVFITGGNKMLAFYLCVPFFYLFFYIL